MSDININVLNEVYSKINLNDFFEEEYCDFAIYRVLQRLPNIIDGFPQTQRKIIYTMVDQKIEKKIKVSDLASMVSLATKYHHGSMSIEIAISNLVPKHSNQLPLIKEDGAYGNRAERDAAAARYIETRLYKYVSVLFNSLDNKEFVTLKETEGKKIEPVTMIPILPMLLINGQTQIGVGHASKILPRKLEDVISIFKSILTGQKFNSGTILKPFAPEFKGTIEKTINKNNQIAWKYKGLVNFISKDIVEIVEVPPAYTRISYIKILNKLKDDKKIRSYTEDIAGNSFKIKVQMPDRKDPKYFGNLPEEDRKENLIELFKLTEQQVENLTFIDTKDNIKKANSVLEIVQEYTTYLIGIYTSRKKLIIGKSEFNILKNKEKIRFIESVNDETLILKKKSKKELNSELLVLNFKQIDDSFEHLFSMPISSLTIEKIDSLQSNIKNDELLLETIKNTKPTDMWLKDIIEFERLWKLER